MKQRITAFLLLIAMLLGMAGCGNTQNAKEPNEASLQIVTTIFPLYDWTREILGDNPAGAEVTMLLDNGVDLHSFQPTSEDILKISTCDLFLYVGGESDEWVEDALKEATNPDMIVLNLLDLLGDAVKEEEVVEGMEAEEEEEDGEEPEYDEHVWLSLRNAKVLCDAITEALGTLDPDHAEVYRQNNADYQSELEALDRDYQDAVDQAELRTVLFGDRFPFRYLADDYGLTYYAAFAGCSAETEASFETVIFLAQKVDELSLPAVLTIEGTDHRIAQTIVENTAEKNREILTLDSMQSTTAKDVQAGASYLSIMRENLGILGKALKTEVNTADSAEVYRGNSVYDDVIEPEIEDREELLSMTEGVDVDLTTLSSTMVYAEVYNMMYEPEGFVGKVIRMDGFCNSYYDEATGKNYYACIIQDATACCAQGVEFVLAEDYGADDYPQDGDWITVTGIFDTYEEGDYTYCTLRDATMSS